MQHYLNTITYYFAFFFFPFVGFTQSIDSITAINTTVKESSGLILMQDLLITMNDSGGDNALYELDTITGSINRRIVVENATNHDWEALTRDDDFIYIGDFGNNDGSRTDLRVYKVSIVDYLSTTNDSVSAQIITFDYEDQTDFTPLNMQTNFDAEAMVSIGDSLYIFSKNWLDRKTKIYSLSKSPGDYTISFLKELNVNFLVTDATYNPHFNSVILIGYWAGGNYMAELGGILLPTHPFGNVSLSTNLITKPVNSILQLEGITYKAPNLYWVTCENGNGQVAQLFEMFYQPISVGLKNHHQTDFKTFYNRFEKTINVVGTYDSGLIYDVNGKFIRKITGSVESVEDLMQGIYLFRFLIYGNEVIKKIAIW
ncbi:MAG: hypothetical protein M9897_01920 [Brumimicrobium sp.]|nr:hypothetical protein [Brumimicrobium sp.]